MPAVTDGAVLVLATDSERRALEGPERRQAAVETHFRTVAKDVVACSKELE